MTRGMDRFDELAEYMLRNRSAPIPRHELAAELRAWYAQGVRDGRDGASEPAPPTAQERD